MTNQSLTAAKVNGYTEIHRTGCVHLTRASKSRVLQSQIDPWEAQEWLGTMNIYANIAPCAFNK